MTKTSISFVSSLWDLKNPGKVKLLKWEMLGTQLFMEMLWGIWIASWQKKGMSLYVPLSGQSIQQYNQKREIASALWSICKTYSMSLTTSAWEILLIFRHFAEVKLNFLFNCWHAGPIFSVLFLLCVAFPLPSLQWKMHTYKSDFHVDLWIKLRAWSCYSIACKI